MSRFSDYYNKNVAIKIRKYRLEFGYTQEQLSEMIGKNIKYIGHIERCERKISNTILIELMALFKVQPSEFYNFDEKYNWDKEN